MKRIYIFALLLFLAAALPSCRKDAPELMNPGETELSQTPSQVFKTFWHGMNNSYGFWDIDPTDWDRVYDEYLPLFEALDGADPETEEEAAELFGTMQTLYTQICGKLIDHHLSITFYPESEYEFAVSPGYLDISARDYFHDAIIGNIIPACIEANRQAGRIEEFVQGRYEVEGDSDNMAGISYKIDGVIYLRFSGFAFQGVLQKDPGGPVEQVLRNYQRMILETPDIKGVIIDVRDNGGGYLADKVGTSSLLFTSFIAMAVGTVAILFLPQATASVLPFVILFLVIYFFYNVNYALTWAMMDEGKIPERYSGTAAGIISTVGYLPEIFCSLLAGVLIDGYPGVTGYRYYFSFLIVMLLLGAGMVLVWKRFLKKSQDK